MVKRLTWVLVCLLTAQTVARAHHSYGAYFRDQTVRIDGVIEHLTIGNPHAIIELRTADGVLITAEWRSAFQLKRTGFVDDMLAVGDHVIVSACPARDPEAHRVALVSEVVRPRDGWRWTNAGINATR